MQREDHRYEYLMAQSTRLVKTTPVETTKTARPSVSHALCAPEAPCRQLIRPAPWPVRHDFFRCLTPAANH